MARLHDDLEGRQPRSGEEGVGGLGEYGALQRIAGLWTQGQPYLAPDRLALPGRYTWRDINPLVDKAREAMAMDGGGEEPGDNAAADGGIEDQAGTFLYMVRKAMLDARPRTTSSVVFNRKRFRLDTRKEADASSTSYFAAKNILAPSGTVTRMEALLTNPVSGEKTPFRLWYETIAASHAATGGALPLRFEYQAKSFLRLTFEADPKVVTPAIRYAFGTSKEAA